MARSLSCFSVLFIAILILVPLGGCSSDSGPVATDNNGGGGPPPPPPPPPGGGGTSSYDLIDDALADGTIDYETSLQYKVFALYGDTRLPAEFQGDDSGIVEVNVEQEIMEQWDQMSAATQDAVGPFVVNPIYEGSWVNPVAPGGGTAPSSQACLPWLEACIISQNWVSIDSGNGKVRVWYHKAEVATDLPKTNIIVNAIDNDIWPKLTSLMDGREPVSDAGVINNGGDGKLDIILMDINAEGITSYPPGSEGVCPGRPRIIKIRRTIASTKALEATVAHEIMHAILFTYPSECIAGTYAWIHEATATWAEHYVYPDYQTEQVYASEFMFRPELPIDFLSSNDNDLHEYGAYLFFLYLEQFNASWIPAIWNASGTSNPLQAIENGLQAAGSTDLENRWPEFVRRNWNVAPIDKYAQWDGMTTTVKGVTRFPFLGIEPGDTARMDISLPYLSARYHQFKFEDDNVRFVTFVNGMKYKMAKATTAAGIEYFEPTALSAAETKGLSVQLLVKVANQPWQNMDVTDQASVVFCRDQLEGRLEELVVVYANSDFADKSRMLEPKGLSPLLLYSNTGCWKWEGIVNVEHDDGCEINSINSDMAWSTVFRGIRMFKPMDKYAELTTSIPFQPVSGSYSWTLTGGCACTVSGSGSWSAGGTSSNFISTYNGVLSGAYNRGFDLFGFSPLQFGTETRVCPDGTSTQSKLVNISISSKATEHPQRVSADGTRISGTIDLGNGKFATLDLTPQRESLPPPP